MIELIKQLKEQGKKPGAIAKAVELATKPEFMKIATCKPYSSKSANDITKSIERFVDNIPKGWISRINNMGTMRGGIYTKSNSKRGIPALIGCYDGKFIGVEVKYGKDKLSEHQIKCHENIYNAKGYIFTVKSFDEFFELFCLHLLEI